MDPATATAAAQKAYETGGIGLVLVLALLAGFWLLLRSNDKRAAAREEAMGQRLDASAAACLEREQSLTLRLDAVERARNDDLKALLKEVVDTNRIAARAFAKLAETESGSHRAISRSRE